MLSDRESLVCCFYEWQKSAENYRNQIRKPEKKAKLNADKKDHSTTNRRTIDRFLQFDLKSKADDVLNSTGSGCVFSEIQLAGNPSYFAVFSIVRHLAFENWSQQLFRKWSGTGHDLALIWPSESPELNTVRVSKIVNMGLKSVFKIIHDIRFQQPDLCIKTLGSLLNILHGHAPESLANEPKDTIEPLFELLTELATFRVHENGTNDSDYTLMAVAYSCLLSLAVAVGTTDKILMAVTTIIKCSRTFAIQNVKAPVILRTLQKTVLDVILNHDLKNSFSDKNVWFETGVPENSLIESFLIRMPFDTYPGRYSAKCITSDGQYLYILTSRGLFKVGSGYGSTIKGHVYVLQPEFQANDRSWIGFCANNIYLRRSDSHRKSELVLIDRLSLRSMKTVVNLDAIDANAPILFADRESLGTIIPVKDNGFAIRTLNPKTNPVSLQNELTLKLSKKFVTFFGTQSNDIFSITAATPTTNQIETERIRDEIAEILAGKDFAVVRTKSGKVYYCGRSGSLGIKGGSTAAASSNSNAGVDAEPKSSVACGIDKWMELVVSRTSKTVQLTVGHDGLHVLFRCDDGSVYFAGLSKRGEDCESSGSSGGGSRSKLRKLTKASRPKRIGRFDGNSIRWVAVNSGSSALVTDRGELFVFGKDTAFCEASGSNSNGGSGGQILALKSERIRKVALGKAHLVALNDRGEVFTFGINNKNQCGRGQHRAPITMTGAMAEGTSSGFSGTAEADSACASGSSAAAAAAALIPDSMNYDYETDDLFDDDEPIPDERIYDEFFPQFCAYNQHVWAMDECMICTVCKKCTGYSYDCLASKNRERKPGEVCGCGMGDSGCLECGLCRTCAQAVSTSSDFLSRQANTASRAAAAAEEEGAAVAAMKPDDRRRNKNYNQKNIDKISNSLMSIILSKDISGVKNRRKVPASDPKASQDAPKKIDTDFEKETLKASIVSPAKLQFPSELSKIAVVEIACGLHHSVLLLANGKVLTFGSNQYGQLGCGDLLPRSNVQLVRIPDVAVQVAAGNNHTVIRTANNQVFTMGSNCKDQLGRNEPHDCEQSVSDSSPWFSFPGAVRGFGSETAKQVSWIGASSDSTFLIVDESLISAANLVLSKVLATKNHLLIIPNEPHEALFKCLVINKTDGSTKSYTNENQALFVNRIACLDPFYNVIWSYDSGCDEIACYNATASLVRNVSIEKRAQTVSDANSSPQLLMMRSAAGRGGSFSTASSGSSSSSSINGFGVGAGGGPTSTASAASAVAGGSVCDLFRSNGQQQRKPFDFTTILKAEITLPVESSSGGYLTRSHMSMFLLCCLDTLNSLYDLSVDDKQPFDGSNGGLAGRRQNLETNFKNICNGKNTNDSLKTVNRFEGFGGGWGYSAQSVEALRFMCEENIMLFGFGVFGGRGVYTGKLKVYDLGLDDGQEESDGDLITETDDIPFDCLPRQKFRLMLNEPILVHANNWYVVWCKINGPSSDCGSNGRLSVISDDKLTFHFKSSKKSNNGTDVHAGQLPQLIYRPVINTDLKVLKNSMKFNSNHQHCFLSKKFARTINKDVFQSLIQLLEFAWKSIREILLDINSSQYLYSMIEVKKLTYIGQSSLRLLRTFIMSTYTNCINVHTTAGSASTSPSAKNAKNPGTSLDSNLTGEQPSIVECVVQVREILTRILIDGLPKVSSFEKKQQSSTKKRTLKTNEIFLKMVTSILDECHNTFVSCFAIFYPTDQLKWTCLCLALNSISENQKPERNNDLLLTAILSALCSPTVRLRDAFTLNKLTGDTNSLVSASESKKPSQSLPPYPLLIERMTTEMPKWPTECWSWLQVFERLLGLIVEPVKYTLVANPKNSNFANCTTENACNLIVKIVMELIYQFRTVATEVEISLGQSLLTTPNRFAKQNQSKCWNTGNYLPDAICFQVDKPGIVIAGCVVYGGFGNFDYEIDLLDNIMLKPAATKNESPSQFQRWAVLETGKGTFTNADCVDGCVELKLQKPVPIRENVKYAIRVKINGNRTSNGDCGLSSVKCSSSLSGTDETVFKFSTCALSLNGTTQIRGQIPSLLYYNNPVDDQSIEQEKLLVESQIKNVLLVIWQEITNAFNGIAMEIFAKSADSSATFDFHSDLVASSEIVTKLIPLVLAQIAPLALTDAKFAVHLLECLPDILTNVSNLNQANCVSIDNLMGYGCASGTGSLVGMIGSEPRGSGCANSINQTVDSFIIENPNSTVPLSTTATPPTPTAIVATTTSQYYTWVQSDHPYKPATVYNYRVIFPSCVKWFSIEFDPMSNTIQVEDCLRIYLPCYENLNEPTSNQQQQQQSSTNESHQQQTPYWSVLGRYSLGDWPTGCIVLPGNEVIFSLETASDYLKNDKFNMAGSGAAGAGAANVNGSNQSWGFRCLVIGYENPIGNIITGTNNNNKSTLNLYGLKHLEVELAFAAGMCSSTLLKKDIDLALNKDEDFDLELTEIVSDEILKNHSTLLSKGLLMNEFPSIYQALDGNLTYRGQSNESQFLKNFINCTNDTSGNRLAQWLQPESRLDFRNSEVVLNLEQFQCGVPSTILIRTRDQYNDIVLIEDLKLSVYAVHLDSNNLHKKYHMRKFSKTDYEIATISVPYEPTIRDKMSYQSISIMKEYQNWSFEELRFASLCLRKPIESTSVVCNADGTYNVTWIPKMAGLYTLVVKADDQIMEKISPIDVKDSPKTMQKQQIQLVALGSVKKPAKSTTHNKLRKFVLKFSSGLRIRTHPTLQSEQVGLVPVNAIITFIDDLHNDDGTWVRLAADSIRQYVQISGTVTEAWCLQYNKHTAKTLLVPIDENIDPYKTIYRKLPDLHERKKLTIPFPNPSGYKVVKCDLSSHCVRAQPSRNAMTIGSLFLGNIVTIVDHVVNDEGYWVQLDQSTKTRYSFGGYAEAWSLAVDASNVLYLQNVEEPSTFLDVPGTPKKERKMPGLWTSRQQQCGREIEEREEKLLVKISDDDEYQISSKSLSPNDFFEQSELEKTLKTSPQLLKKTIILTDPKTETKIKRALSASVAESIRTVFAAFLWHEGLVHDAMASATYLKFYPGLIKKDVQQLRKSDRAKHRHSLEISSNYDNLLKLPQPETLKNLSKLAICHDGESNLPIALKSLLFLWNELNANCLHTIRMQPQVQRFLKNENDNETALEVAVAVAIDDEVFLNDSVYEPKKNMTTKKTKHWKTAFQSLVPETLKTICELCKETLSYNDLVHFREKHAGCGQPNDGSGYNTKGIYVSMRSGICGEIAQDGDQQIYLLCTKCRKNYNSFGANVFERSASTATSCETLSPTSSSCSTDFPINLKNNAMFLLTLSNSFPNKTASNTNDNLILNEDNNVIGDFVSSFSKIPPCNSLKTFGVVYENPNDLTTTSSNSADDERSNLFDRSTNRPVSDVPDEELMKNLRFHRSISMCMNGNFLNNSCDNSNNQNTYKNNNFIKDSGLFLLGNPSSNLQKVMLNYSRVTKISDSAVLRFVYGNHDLDSLHIAMKQSLRKTICRIYASQAFTWLLNTVTQPVALHDLLWWLVLALTSSRYDSIETDQSQTKSKQSESSGEIDLRIPDHPLADLKMAGFAKKTFPKNFHKLLQTISDLMLIIPMGSALQQMAVRCWGLRFYAEDHKFLHQSHVFSIISNILSRSDDTEDCLAMTSSMTTDHVSQEYPIVEKLRDLTSGLEIKTSTKPNLIVNLTDYSTETFWESSEDDRGKSKLITLYNTNRYIIYYVCVHIDNSRDQASRVSSLTFLAGQNVEELTKVKVIDIDANINLGTWISCPMIYAFHTNVIQIELRGPDATLRVRQVRILGESTNESLIVKNRQNAQMIQQRNCEAETLRVFRLITSQVFEKLIKKEPQNSRTTATISQHVNMASSSMFRNDSGHLSFSESFDKFDDNNDLKEHMVGILFSRSKLSHLQKQIIVHVVKTIRIETQNLREEWESQLEQTNDETNQQTQINFDTSSNFNSPDTKNIDSYCFEMLSLVLALSGSEIGRIYLSNQLVLISDLLTLLHVGSARIQRQVIALLRRILSKITPENFAKIIQVDKVPKFDFGCFNFVDKPIEVNIDSFEPGLLDIFLAVIAKSLTVQVKQSKEIKSRSLKILKFSQTTNFLAKSKLLSLKFWWLCGETTKKLSDDVISLINDMTNGKISEQWSNAAKGSISENLVNLTRLNNDQKSSEHFLINSPILWLALSSLCVTTQEHVDNLTSIQWMNREKIVSRSLCTNHDDGETIAIIQCATCGSLCLDCDRFLHLNRKSRLHVRKVCKEEEESIKIEVHEGCARIKLFWLLALADYRSLKALIEYRETATSSSFVAISNQTDHCRFCGRSTSTNVSSSLFDIGNVCGDLDCQESAKFACQKTLDCGHLCGGVVNETQCLPCLQKCSPEANLLQDADDMCMICFTDALASAPAIQLTCGHIFHYNCCRQILTKKWNGPRIVFNFSLCPICKVDIKHQSLKDLVEPIKELYEDVKRKALMRMEFEGTEIDTDLSEHQLVNYAMNKYAYYICSKCKKAYYGGDVRCEVDAAADHFDANELVCGACSDVSRAKICAKHGTDFLEYKCRYCCSVAVFFCFGTTHFCNACHEDHQNIIKMPQKDLPQCPVGPKSVQLKGDECPLHVKHPITGEEFALGCGICRNVQTF